VGAFLKSRTPRVKYGYKIKFEWRARQTREAVQKRFLPTFSLKK
jgi:hypothetical protein